jgi:type III secretion system FlhB-like substrate exporter
LLSAFDVGAEVPPELYQLIADIYVYILKAGYELHMS